MKISKLENDVTKLEIGSWKAFQVGDTGSIRNLRTGELIQLDRKEIDDLVTLLNEIKREMIMEHHG